MANYLYGASVQGIQEFIFETNKLQEIVGASEIVKKINSDFKDSFQKSKNVNIILNAAGNIKAIFHEKEELEKHILEFEKKIMQMAYGITLSQALVNMQKAEFQEQTEAIKELERRLKIQRNRPTIPLDASINIMKLTSKSSRAIFTKQKDDDLDMSSKQKRDAYASWFHEKRKQDANFEELKEISALSNGKNKVAVIHIDGNKLGQIVPKLGNQLSSFSEKLDIATKKAFNDAKQNKRVRDIILGGDDVTLICDANDALLFTKEYLENFEKESKNIGELKKLKIDGLTACAGIAFINEKYPFHYAVDLAEVLCIEAKKHTNREQSALMFHNIQSANFQSWEKFIQDELTIKKETGTIRLDFGPYYLDDAKQANIGDFMNSLEAYRCDGSPISRLRSWMSELYKSDENAKNLLARINDVTEQSGKWNHCIMDKNLKKFNQKLSNKELIIEKDEYKKTPIYDILQILSVTEAKQ